MIICGIAIKPAKRAAMVEKVKILVTVESGLEGDRCGTKYRRQVTVLSLDQWKLACVEAGAPNNLSWTSRRANICVSGVSFKASDKGKHLQLGSDLVLEITGETEPCSRMDEVHPGLKDALTSDWRGGVTCRVIKGGTIYVCAAGRFIEL